MRPEQQGEVAALRSRLRHVYWVGAGSGAGKSAIARRVAGQHGLGVYSADQSIAGHGGRSRPQDAPLLSKFKTMDMDQRWVLRSPETMLERDRMFTELLRAETKRLGLRAIEIDTTITEDDAWLKIRPDRRGPGRDGVAVTRSA